MTWQDFVNGGYEMLGGLAILHHCYVLYRDKQVKGVSFFSIVFFTTWGYWNLYYYPHLNQWVSFAGGVMIVASNTLWISMMWYYLRKQRAEEARARWAYGPDGLAGGDDDGNCLVGPPITPAEIDEMLRELERVDTDDPGVFVPGRDGCR